jgi:hypothetical protein
MSSFVLGVLTGAGASIASGLAGWGGRGLLAARERVKASIELKLSARVAGDDRLRFGLLHVRDGQGKESERAINETHWFKRQGISADVADVVTLLAETRYRRKRGLQFKCFVDYKGLAYETVSKLFAAEDAIGGTTRSARPDRAMFLLASYETTSEDGLTNNFSGRPETDVGRRDL